MTLKELLEVNIDKFGEYPFLYYREKQYTNLETKKYADQLASGLQSRLGITKGDRVVVCMENCPEVIFSYQGITRSGAVNVPVMFTLHPREIHYIIKNCEAKAVICSAYTAEQVKKSLEGLENPPAIIAADLPSSEGVLSLYDLMTDNTLKEAEENDEDTAVILYTSGTTGNPKGVLLTHKNLYSNAVNSSEHSRAESGITIGALPLAHVYGLTISNACFLTGSSVVIFSKFNPKEIFLAIEKYKIKSFSAVPAMIHAMVSYPKADDYDTSSLESVGSGSAPLPAALLNEFKNKFGAVVLEGYGLSEAAPVVTAHNKYIEIKPGSVGIPIPGVEIKIVDDFNEEVPVGDVGELIVRGDNVTPGYYQNEEESKKVLQNGWLHTGDMARVDNEGYLYIVDRKKDLIIRGGLNVYPRDIEELLNGHEKVLEAAVVGVPDERMGEEMVACIVKKPGAEVTEEELIRICQEHLAKNKTPRSVVFMESLPRNGVGKILKTHLRQTAADIVSQIN
ncbi:class I adenylate-forming enzyme family protein [Peribacillus sp. SCS-37]|uniref:class I adenylate-forming enzyme family protein n=1 Tax=Paraperibacillus esterisolvens TaxID=3115296 RepID=UPI00390618B9